MDQKSNALKVCLVQLASSSDKTANLLAVEKWISQAYASYQPDLIALPEMFPLMGGDIKIQEAGAENLAQGGDALHLLARLAKQYKVYIHGGSFLEKDQGHYYNTTPIFDPNGECIARYRKMNLFNFRAENTEYNESDRISAGCEIISYSIKNMKIGCAICYDIRFGYLFRRLILDNVKIIIIPSSFTYETGIAHWDILCKARAIETQSFIIAPAQTGIYKDKGVEKKRYGHSLIIDPWGDTLASLNEEEGIACATLDLDYLETIRAKFGRGENENTGDCCKN